MSAEAKSGLFWNARHGFVCVAALVLASLALNQLYRLAYENSLVFAGWVNANLQLAELGFLFIRGCVWLLIGFLVSQSTSFETFARRSGLDQKPTLGGWLCAWAAIAFGLAILAIVGQGWGRPDVLAPVYSQSSEGYWRFFMVYRILFWPFVAEVVMRGFAYRAFRGSYNRIFSTFIVAGVYAIYFHWGLVSRDLTALVSLATGSIALCVIRERTTSTWNCVLFHAVYNSTVMRQWVICFVGMSVVLLLCGRHFFSKQKSHNDCANDGGNS